MWLTPAHIQLRFCLFTRGMGPTMGTWAQFPPIFQSGYIDPGWNKAKWDRWRLDTFIKLITGTAGTFPVRSFYKSYLLRSSWILILPPEIELTTFSPSWIFLGLLHRGKDSNKNSCHFPIGSRLDAGRDEGGEEVRWNPKALRSEGSRVVLRIVVLDFSWMVELRNWPTHLLYMSLPDLGRYDIFAYICLKMKKQ